MIVYFIGPRKIRFTENLWDRVKSEIEKLILNSNADTFLFCGRNGEFEYMCYEAVTELRFKYRHLSRIYVRNAVDRSKEIPVKLQSILFERTADTEIFEIGKKSMIKINESIIDVCDVLVGYLNERSVSFKKPFSVVQCAVDYARQNGKRIINLF